MGGLFSCCCPEDEATAAPRGGGPRGFQAAREQRGTPRNETRDVRPSGRRPRAHKAQAKMRTQNAADDRAAEQRIADLNS